MSCIYGDFSESISAALAQSKVLTGRYSVKYQLMLYKDQIIDAMVVDTNTVVIDWALGNTCNYSCSYCWPEAYSGDQPMPRLTPTIVKNIQHLGQELLSKPDNAGKQLEFVLTGGEPTLYPDITQLCELLHSLGRISLLTNGSRTLAWWERHYQLFDQVMISYHASRADPDHITAVLDLLLGKTAAFLHVMLDPALFQPSISAYHTFTKRFDQKPVRVKVQLIDYKRHVIGYTPDQLVLIDQLPEHRSQGLHALLDGHRKHSMLNLRDGSSVEFKPKTVQHLRGEFKGYHCSAHHEFLSIDNFGNLGQLNCRQAYAPTISLYSDHFVDQFNLTDDKLICAMDRCGCIGLYTTNKKRIDLVIEQQIL